MRAFLFAVYLPALGQTLSKYRPPFFQKGKHAFSEFERRRTNLPLPFADGDAHDAALHIVSNILIWRDLLLSLFKTVC